MTKEKMELILALEGNSLIEMYKGCKIEIVRHPSLLHLNGYVTFPTKRISKRCIDSLLCHGGITYEEETDTEMIIGFDTAHYGDLCPCHFYMPLLRSSVSGEYRNMDYCISECKSIIEQVSVYMKREEDKRKNVIKKIKKLEKLMREINDSWEELEDTEFLEEGYPFEASFDEVVANVSDWVEAIEEN